MRFISHSALIVYLGVAVLHLLSRSRDMSGLWTFVLFQSLAMGCFGLMVSNFGAMAMEPVGAVAGAGASLQGFVTPPARPLSGCDRQDLRPTRPCLSRSGHCAALQRAWCLCWPPKNGVCSIRRRAAAIRNSRTAHELQTGTAGLCLSPGQGMFALHVKLYIRGVKPAGESIYGKSHTRRAADCSAGSPVHCGDTGGRSGG